MSDVSAKEKKTFTIGSYNAEIRIDGKTFECITVEGRDPQAAMEKFTRWYTIYRSTYFPGLIYEDVEKVVEQIQSREYDENQEPLLQGRFHTAVTIKPEGEEETVKDLEVSFYKRFII